MKLDIYRISDFRGVCFEFCFGIKKKNVNSLEDDTFRSFPYPKQLQTTNLRGFFPKEKKIQEKRRKSWLLAIL